MFLKLVMGALMWYPLNLCVVLKYFLKKVNRGNGENGLNFRNLFKEKSEVVLEQSKG